jgi:4-hydroxy-4-methyl-2-oxoglutarate aldolase
MVTGEHVIASRRLARLDSSVISDVLDEFGVPGQVAAAEIRALAPWMRVAGPAFCIQGQAVSAERQSKDLDARPAFEMFRHMYAGCVAVVDTGGFYLAGPWGENTALSAAVRGCAGVVIDGSTRDGPELSRMAFPTFARLTTPVRIDDRWEHTAFGVPVSLPAQVGSTITVTPGDFVLADADGVVVVPAEMLEDVIEAGEEVIRIEDRIRQELVRGIDREEVYRRHPRFDHILGPWMPG